MAPFASAGSAPRIVLLVTAVAFALSEVTIRLSRPARRDLAHARRADRGSIIAVIGGIGAGVLLAAWLAAASTGTVHRGGVVLFGGGIAFMWIGIALRQWAVWVLGPFFTVVVTVGDQQPAVDRGPYRWIRHPSYSGLLLTTVGLGMAFENWLSIFSLTILPLLGLAIRIRVEEHALLAAPDEPYQAYAATHRWRLVPGLW